MGRSFGGPQRRGQIQCTRAHAVVKNVFTQRSPEKLETSKEGGTEENRGGDYIWGATYDISLLLGKRYGQMGGLK